MFICVSRGDGRSFVLVKVLTTFQCARCVCRESTIVFDHLHVIKLFNEKLTELRRVSLP